MIKPESKRPVVIEDLLRLKRAERPPAEFWTQFDRELRAKQLTALLVRKPWWQRVPSPWPLFARHRILLGAAAVLAVTLVSLRTSRVPSLIAPVATSPAPAAGAVVAELAAPVRALENNFVSDESRLAASRRGPEATQVLVPAVAIVAESAVAEAPTTRQVAAVVRSESVVPVAMPVAGPRFVAAPITANVTVEKSAARLLAGSSGFEARATSGRTAVEPLQHMTSPSESRRTRLLTAMVSMASLEASPRTAERVANRIDEERLYEQVSRFGARGDRLNVKF